jgi:hypothetical protein
MFVSARAAVGAALVFGLLCAGAYAQEKNACDQFKWSVARERAWFAAARKPAASGTTIAVGEGYAIALQPDESIAFPLPPERAPKAGGFGATLGIAAIDKPGVYQITLSDEAWLDVIQGAAELKSAGFSGQKDCPGARKSVRFELSAGPATLQLSNAAGAAINLAIAPAQ